jgi:hypothetical protein
MEKYASRSLRAAGAGDSLLPQADVTANDEQDREAAALDSSGRRHPVLRPRGGGAPGVSAGGLPGSGGIHRSRKRPEARLIRDERPSPLGRSCHASLAVASAGWLCRTAFWRLRADANLPTRLRPSRPPGQVAFGAEWDGKVLVVNFATWCAPAGEILHSSRCKAYGDRGYNFWRGC